MTDYLKRQFQKMPVLFSADLKSSYGMQKPGPVYTYTNHTELLWILEGTGKFICNGIVYPIRPGDAILCNSGTAHGITADTHNGLNAIQVFVQCVKFNGIPEGWLVPTGYCPVIHRVEERTHLDEMFFQLLAESRGRSAGDTVLPELLCKLYELIQDQLPARPLNVGWQAVGYIDKHFREADLTVEKIAEALQVNVYSMGRIFKQMTGYSPLQYLTRRRIGAAQSLLLQTQEPIQIVAEIVGFSNLKRFISAFRKQTGLLPQNYRNIWKEL